MAGEHNTPVGTPILLAPGKIFLVGEYAVLDEGSAVLAAIGRYAKAQFIPRMESMSPLVAEVVARAKAHLGDMTAALPSGAVLVAANDFQLGNVVGGLGSSAAMAVAATASVFESLGLDLDGHKADILAIADAGRRSAQHDVGSGADTVASTYGGLVEVARSKGAVPAMRNLPVPAGLHVVLFATSPTLSTKDMMAGLRGYAKREKLAFGHAVENLRQIAHRFVDDIVAGNATGAVRASGDYGDELAALALAAGVPIISEDFAHAAQLARDFGGIAKPAAAGGGRIGLAVFAAAEAARSFRRACSGRLSPLDGDIDTLGVRCQVFEGVGDADEITLTTSTPAPEEDEFEEDAETTIHRFDSVAVPPIVPKKDTVSASPIEVHTTEDVVRVQPPTPRRRRLRRTVLPGVALLAALAAVGWFNVRKQREHHSPALVMPVQLPVTMPPPPTAPATAAPAREEPPTPTPAADPIMPAPVATPTPELPGVPPAPQVRVVLPPPTAAAQALLGKHPAIRPHSRDKLRSVRTHSKRHGKTAASPRAGGLSADDF